MNKAVCIQNRNNQLMYGVLSLPEIESCNRTLVIFSQVGISTKTGVGDYLKILSNSLAKHGYSVLRFDQNGTGDSTGDFSYVCSISELFRQVQTGYFKNDMLDVIDWASIEFNGYRFFLFGECGGGISWITACAERVSLISGIIMLAAPVLLYPINNETNNTLVRPFDAHILYKSYFKKLCNPIYIYRLLTGQSDLKLIIQSSFTMIVRLKNELSKYLFFFKIYKKPDHKRFNMIFWDSFQKLCKENVPILFLMPELDNETFEFDNEFNNKVLKKSKSFSNNCSVISLPNTDHSIMFQEARINLKNNLIEWLDKYLNNKHE